MTSKGTSAALMGLKSKNCAMQQNEATKLALPTKPSDDIFLSMCSLSIKYTA